MIVIDVWELQVNGVVCIFIQMCCELEVMGYIVDMIMLLEFKMVLCLMYLEICFLILLVKCVCVCIEKFVLQVLYIVIEGLFGLVVCVYVLCYKLFYMMVYYMCFLEYVQVCFGILLVWMYCFLCWFYSFVQVVMVLMFVVLKDFVDYGIINGVLWMCGVDLDIFIVQCSNVFNMVYLIFLYVGCVVVEKNVEVFLELDLLGLKWVVGEGLVLVGLKVKYLNVSYFGVFK